MREWFIFIINYTTIRVTIRLFLVAEKNLNYSGVQSYKEFLCLFLSKFSGTMRFVDT